TARTSYGSCEGWNPWSGRGCREGCGEVVMDEFNGLPVGPEDSPSGAPGGPPPVPPPGPIAQSVEFGFRAVYVLAALFGLFWATSSIRQIPSDSQVVVRGFGRIVRAQQAGLLVAWPRPIEQVQILPGPARQLSHDVSLPLAPSEKYESVVG